MFKLSLEARHFWVYLLITGKKGGDKNSPKRVAGDEIYKIKMAHPPLTLCCTPCLLCSSHYQQLRQTNPASSFLPSCPARSTQESCADSQPRDLQVSGKLKLTLHTLTLTHTHTRTHRAEFTPEFSKEQKMS